MARLRVCSHIDIYIFDTYVCTWLSTLSFYVTWAFRMQIDYLTQLLPTTRLLLVLHAAGLSKLHVPMYIPWSHFISLRTKSTAAAVWTSTRHSLDSVASVGGSWTMQLAVLLVAAVVITFIDVTLGCFVRWG